MIFDIMLLNTNTSQCNKYTELLTVFTAHLSNDLNLARIRLICLFITALCKVKSVNYSKLSAGFDSPSAASSCFRRIQRFMAQVDLPTRLISTLIFNILQNDSPVVLVMDRTNWRFGQQNINILMLGISYKSVAIPIMFVPEQSQDPGFDIIYSAFDASSMVHFRSSLYYLSDIFNDAFSFIASH